MTKRGRIGKKSEIGEDESSKRASESEREILTKREGCKGLECGVELANEVWSG